MASTAIPTLLEELLRAEGASGYEEPAARVWRDAASFAEVRTDGIGSSIARVGTEGPLLAAFGHIDEIGLVITHIDADGFLWFSPIGAWDPQILVGQRVAVRGRHRTLPGVVGRVPIHLIHGSEEAERAIDFRRLHIDIGVDGREAAEEHVRVGDSAVVWAEPMPVLGRRLVSRALDNRIGAYVVLESLRRYAREGPSHSSFAAVASAQEEIGLKGAQTAAFDLSPDLAVAVDGWHASDAPGVGDEHTGDNPLGSGPVIGRGPTLAPKVADALIDTAEALGLRYSIAGYGSIAPGFSTATDADAVQASRDGVPAGLISVPVRYLHSPVEMVDLDDVEAAVRLLVGFALRFDRRDLVPGG